MEKSFPVLFFCPIRSHQIQRGSCKYCRYLYIIGLEVDSFDRVLVCVLYELVFFDLSIVLDGCVIHVCKTRADGSGLLVL